MCGRFSLSQSAETLSEVFQLDQVPPLEPHYNIAPSQQVAAVLVDQKSQKRQLKLLRWGLIPAWAKDVKLGAKLINARAETVTEKPSFRSAFKNRRCLILADGFYEWQQLKGRKQPFYIHQKDNQPFAFAGLWEHWQGPNDQVVDSCTILTTEPNELLRPLHNRMPVVLKPEDYDLWLAADVHQPELLQPLLRPYASEEMKAYPVSPRVNNPVSNDSACIEKVAVD